MSHFAVLDRMLLGMNDIETTNVLLLPETIAEDQQEVEAQDLAV